MLDLNDLRLFVHVCEHQGFSRAARAMGLPKSSISRRIGELERRLGTVLLVRNARHFSLTEIGRSLYQHGAGMMSVVTEAEELLELRATQVAGLVRLSTSIAFGQCIVPALLVRLMAHHPGLSIHVEIANRPADTPSEGFDVVLRAHTWPLTDSSLVQRRIGIVPMLVVASPDYLAAGGIPTDIEQLATRDVLTFGFEREVTSWLFTRTGGQSRIVSFRPRLQMSDMVALRTMALAAVGITQLPEYLCRSDLRSGRLLEVLPEWKAVDSIVSVLTASRRLMNPAVLAVVRFLSEEMPRAVAAYDVVSLPNPAARSAANL